MIKNYFWFFLISIISIGTLKAQSCQNGLSTAEIIVFTDGY